MWFRQTLFLGLLAITLPSAGCLARKVSLDFNRQVDFSQFRTFTIKTGTPCRSPALEAWVWQRLEHELVRKGLRRVDSNPDIYVIHHAVLDEATRLEVIRLGYENVNQTIESGGHESGYVSRQESFAVGSLIVEILDADLNQVLWRGKVEHIVGGTDAAKKKQIGGALTRMLKEFPPPFRQ